MAKSTPAGVLDPLTGLPGRVQFIHEVDAALAAASAEQRQALWVATVAMPRLAMTNAGLGPAVGDGLISALAQTIRDELPEVFALCRLEGAEFACASFGPPRRVSKRGDDSPVRFLGIVLESAGMHLFTTLLTGLAHHAGGDGGETLLRKARLALARARMDDRSDIEVYDDALGEFAAERTELARELPAAIERGELRLHYQPKVALGSGRLIGVEALVRWARPDGRMVSPGSFVPAAEVSALIVPLGDWTLGEAIRQAASWREAGMAPMHVAVNVSALQFQKTDIVARVEELLATHGLPPEWLELELTEGALTADPDEIAARLARLRDMGVELAIDDFGTGYSSLGYLKRFPVHRLKIDQSFVRDCHEDATDAAIVRSVITLGHNLGLRVLAEGVETQGHADLLLAERCDEAQGYFYARPLEPLGLEEFARRPPA